MTVLTSYWDGSEFAIISKVVLYSNHIFTTVIRSNTVNWQTCGSIAWHNWHSLCVFKDPSLKKKKKKLPQNESHQRHKNQKKMSFNNEFTPLSHWTWGSGCPQYVARSTTFSPLNTFTSDGPRTKSARDSSSGILILDFFARDCCILTTVSSSLSISLDQLSCTGSILSSAEQKEVVLKQEHFSCRGEDSEQVEHV